MKNVIHVRLPEPVRRLVQIRATQLGITVSALVAALVRRDAEESGVAGLIESAKIEGEKEAVR